MRRFLISNTEKFNGTAQLVYNSQQVLCRIDCTDTDMVADTMRAFKKAVPVTIAELTAGGNFAAGTIVTESDFEISLDDFKREYPYSRNYHLLDLRWPKLKKTEQVQAYYAAIEYRKYCKRNDWYKSKIADSWLANKEFLNDWRKM